MGGTYNGNRIDLIALDCEGVLTPAKRTKNNLLGFSEIQDYCAMVETHGYPPIIIVTGRPASYIEAVIQNIGALGDKFSIPTVTENGAVFWDHNRRAVSGYHPAISGSITDLAQVSAYVNTLINSERDASNNPIMIKEPGKEVCISLNPSGLAVEDVYEIIVERLTSQGMNELVNITHSASAVDITPRGVDKWTGLLHLLKAFEIKPEHVLGVGDTKGDITWLPNVGYRAAPLNATSEIRALEGIFIADYPDARGTAQILQHFILKHHS